MVLFGLSAPADSIEQSVMSPSSVLLEVSRKKMAPESNPLSGSMAMSSPRVVGSFCEMGICLTCIIFTRGHPFMMSTKFLGF